MKLFFLLDYNFIFRRIRLEKKERKEKKRPQSETMVSVQYGDKMVWRGDMKNRMLIRVVGFAFSALTLYTLQPGRLSRRFDYHRLVYNLHCRLAAHVSFKIFSFSCRLALLHTHTHPDIGIPPPKKKTWIYVRCLGYGHVCLGRKCPFQVRLPLPSTSHAARALVVVIKVEGVVYLSLSPSWIHRQQQQQQQQRPKEYRQQWECGNDNVVQHNNRKRRPIVSYRLRMQQLSTIILYTWFPTSLPPPIHFTLLHPPPPPPPSFYRSNLYALPSGTGCPPHKPQNMSPIVIRRDRQTSI